MQPIDQIAADAGYKAKIVLIMAIESTSVSSQGATIEIPVPSTDHPRVVIIGGGFAGIELIKKLRKGAYQIVLLDRNNYFTFQPLLYQVATSGLEPGSVTYPLRKVVRKTGNAHFFMAEVEQVDARSQTIATNIGVLHYDYLVIATGSKTQFFDQDPEKVSTLKSVPSALDIRRRILGKLERAAVEPDENQRAAMTNFVIVGGGPTGVELAGALAEMKQHVIKRDYPDIEPEEVQIFLIEGLDRLLNGMRADASSKALRDLELMGVHVMLNTMVQDYDGEVLDLGEENIQTHTLIWAAGVKARAILGLEDAEKSKGRLKVDRQNRVKGLQNVFALGDVAIMETEDFSDGRPMLAPVAMQQGRRLGKNLLRLQRGLPLLPFSYKDKGTMATIGRNRAVADIGSHTIGGRLAWLAWMGIHLLFLVGFRNKLVTLLNWMYNYFSYERLL